MLAGAVVFLFWQNNALKADLSTVEWKLTTLKAERDTVYVQAEYSPPDTIWQTKIRTLIDTVSGQVDTIYEDIPGPLTGNISFDTTKMFGQDHNPLSVQVTGKFWYPAEFSHQNWLLIVPEFGKPAAIVSNGRSPKIWGIGLACAISSRQKAYLGLGGRFNRTSAVVYRQLDQNIWMFGLNYEIF